MHARKQARIASPRSFQFLIWRTNAAARFDSSSCCWVRSLWPLETKGGYAYLAGDRHLGADNAYVKETRSSRCIICAVLSPSCDDGGTSFMVRWSKPPGFPRMSDTERTLRVGTTPASRVRPRPGVSQRGGAIARDINRRLPTSGARPVRSATAWPNRNVPCRESSPLSAVWYSASITQLRRRSGDLATYLRDRWRHRRQTS